MSEFSQQERSHLNDGIEDRFMMTADFAGNIRTFYECKRGTLKDEYEEFFRYFSRLIELIEGLEALSKEKDILDDVRAWRDNIKQENDINKRCSDGLAVFTKLKSSLSKRGLLALPTGGGR